MQRIYKWDEYRNYVGFEDVPDGVRYGRSTLVAPDPSLANPKWMGTGGGWQERKPRGQPDRLVVSTDKKVYDVGEPIQLTIEVKRGNDTIPVNATYFTPVVRTADNIQAEYLELVFVDGVCSKAFTLNDKGKFTVKFDDIEPKPTAVLNGIVQVIVK
jgi:hypothetical protein